MKTTYEAPAMNVVEIMQKTSILQGSDTESVQSVSSGSVGITFGGGKSTDARVRGNGSVDWDDWEE